MNYDTIYGPFDDDPEKVKQFWWEVEEQIIRDGLKSVEEDLKDKLTSKNDIKILNNDNKELNTKLKNLLKFVDDYTRAIERYKFDKKTLQMLQSDWEDYNISLYSGYSRIRQMQLDSDLTAGEGLKMIQKESKVEQIKQQEIERRIRKLLD